MLLETMSAKAGSLANILDKFIVIGICGSRGLLWRGGLSGAVAGAGGGVRGGSLWHWLSDVPCGVGKGGVGRFLELR